MSEGNTVGRKVEGPALAPASGDAATVHEIRPVENLKVCSACLVQNSSENGFCTACGAALPTGPSADETETQIRDGWPSEQVLEHTAIQPPLPAPTAAASPRRRSRALIAALVVCAAGLIGFAVLWQLQAQHAHKLSRALAATRASLTSTQSTLQQTQEKLSSVNALSEKRRGVLLQAKDVLAKVDPLLSSVDTIQNKAGTVSDQGTVLSSDSETFISTVSDLVNYMLATSAAYYDYTYINQAIANANSELGTIRADEGILSGDTSSYSTASDGFGTKASAFTQSVRTLQKQLNAAAGQ